MSMLRFSGVPETLRPIRFVLDDLKRWLKKHHKRAYCRPAELSRVSGACVSSTPLRSMHVTSLREPRRIAGPQVPVPGDT